ncbi:15584_t:CDS:2, partial [Acaulospora colombiana]
RMLNGRVYGYRQSNPFANVQDNEPEFVEWGHGGAGSVRSNNSTGSSMYAGVQSAGRVSIGHTGQGAGTEARERERREKEAAEAKAKEDAAKTDVDPTAGKEQVDTTTTTTADNAESAAAGGDKPGTNGDSSEDKVQEGIEVDRLVPPPSEHGPTVPSAVAEPSSVTAVPEDKQHESVTHERAMMMMGGGGSMTPIMEVDVASPASSKDGAGTPGGEGDGESDETEDEDATDSGTSEEEEDEESGEDTEGESRVTSRCAGVEKVSRHKEQC